MFYCKKIMLFIFLLLLNWGCYAPVEPNPTPEEFLKSNSKNNIILLNHPDFQITPIQYNVGYPQILKINDSVYNVVVEDQWQSLGRIEARFNIKYPGVKCIWVAECDTQATYTYAGQTFNSPIINESSYFSNGVASTMTSFYKDFIGHVVIVIGAAYSEDGSTGYFDYLYFYITLKK